MIDKPTIRWPDRIASLGVARFIVWIAIAAWVYQGVLSDAWKLADWMDDHQFYSWETTDRETLLRYGELPAWNPYWCGGTVGIAAPEDPFFGPDFLLRLFFGVAHGRRLAILFLVVMGFEGMWRLCRRLDATVIAAGFAAVVYGTCDRFVGFIHDGWINFLGFELLPWVILCLVNGITSWRWRLLGGFFFAWIVLSAGTYPTPFTLLAAFYLTIALSIKGLFSGEKRAWLRPWLSAMSIGLVALGLAFGKLLPTLAFLRQFPRVFNPIEAHTAGDLFGNFFNHYGVVLVIGLFAVVMADRVAGIFCGGAILFFALAMGDFGKWTPFHLLKELPIFSQLRFPDRYMVVVLFFIAVGAARGITRFEDAVPALVRRAWDRIFARRKIVRVLPDEVIWVAIALSAYLSYRVTRPYAEEILEGVRIRPGQMYVQEAPRPYDGPFRQSRGNRRDAHIFAEANLGSIYCVAGNPLPESWRLRGDLAQEEYAADPTQATVKRLAWSPNAITLEVDAKSAARIYVNQNWAPAWRTDVGEVMSVDKLLAVDVPAGKHVVHLRYKDGFQRFCIYISLFSVLALLYVFGRDALRWIAKERTAWRTMPTWPDELATSDDDASPAADSPSAPPAAPAVESPEEEEPPKE